MMTLKNPLIDPTKISMETLTTTATETTTEFDPLKTIVRGVTMSGKMDFEMPMMNKVAKNLYIGGCEDGAVLPKSIKHVVSLYKWGQYIVRHALLSSLTVTMYDAEGEDPDADEIESLVRWIQHARESGPVLVHCQAGLNRSGLVVASVLADGEMTVDEAINHLRKVRSNAVLCNRTFENWLRTKENA